MELKSIWGLQKEIDSLRSAFLATNFPVGVMDKNNNNKKKKYQALVLINMMMLQNWKAKLLRFYLTHGNDETIWGCYEYFFFQFRTSKHPKYQTIAAVHGLAWRHFLSPNMTWPEWKAIQTIAEVILQNIYEGCNMSIESQNARLKSKL